MIHHSGHLFVRVPEGAKQFVLDKTFHWLHCIGNIEQDLCKPIKLDDADYSILGLASELGEEDWKGIVEENICDDVTKCPGYNGKECCGKGEWFNYSEGVDGEPCYSSTESGLSLLRHHGLDGNILILKRKN